MRVCNFLMVVSLFTRVSIAEDQKPREYPGLHNVITVTAKLLSGSCPEGEAGFKSLHDLGVKTIISVDGAKPDVELARKAGLRYVHIPIGYDGVPREKALQLAKAVDTLPGLVYLHCHHGKHRSPAAAAAVRRCLDGSCTAEVALGLLKLAGTDPNYKGLYADATAMKPATAEELAKASSEFPAIAAVGDLAKRMVEVDERCDRLKAIRKAGWVTPPGQADLEPAHEALLLREALQEAARLPASAKKASGYRKLLDEAIIQVREIEEELRRSPRDGVKLERSFKALSTGCVQCHQRYRDTRE